MTEHDFHITDMTSRRMALNPFQQLMMKWTKLGPYNAGHVLKFGGQVNMHQWQDAIYHSLNEIQLGRPQFNANETQAAFTYATNLIITLNEDSVENIINTQLNIRFDAHQLPLRFVIRPEKQSFHFIVIYNHWVADSVAMRLLIRKIIHQTGHCTQEPDPQIDLPNTPFQKLFRQHISHLPTLHALKQTTLNRIKMARAYRIPIDNPLDFTSTCQLHHLPGNLITHLCLYAKHHQISVHDVFLAGMGKVLGKFTAAHRTSMSKKVWRGPRNQLALGSIVDIRPFANQSLEGVFGNYLGHYTLLIDDPEEKSVQEILKQVSTQTHTIKVKTRAIKNYTQIYMGKWLWDRQKSKRKQALLFNKHIPITAGISNVNLNNSWLETLYEQSNNKLMDYTRVSPVGPLLPLVFTPTTLGDKTSLCVTYRNTVFNDAEIKKIVGEFFNELQQLSL